MKNDPNGDGIVTDITEWEARRTEIRDLIQHYWLGYRWETAAEDVSGKYEIVYEDNTASYGGFYGIWGACVFNLGDEFRKLSAALLEGQVTVGDKTFGPASTKAEAKQLAIEAWNAGYSVHYIGEPPWGTEGDAVFVNTTGAITEETIPARVRPRVSGGHYHHESGNGRKGELRREAECAHGCADSGGLGRREGSSTVRD